MLKRSLAFISLVLVLLVVFQSPAVSATFSTPSQININGSFSDWGTLASPATGVYVCQDYSNNGEADGSGFTNKNSDINYVWVSVSTTNGGTAPPGPSNLIQDFYYRIDTFGSKLAPGQSYYIQLNLGVAPTGHADHLLQIWADTSATPKVILIMYEYQSPFPVMGAYTTGSVTGMVSNVSNPYPGFISGGGVQDAAASGSIGIYDGSHYAIEVNIPVSWFGPLYGGAISADGTGTNIIISSVFTGTGAIGSVGTVKDTVNDSFGQTCSASINTTTGDVTLLKPYLTFITPPQTITAGSSSSLMTVQLLDAFGNPKIVTANTTLLLTKSSTSGRFDTSAAGAFDGSITQVTILAGSSTASFYYKDTTAGVVSITAAEYPAKGWTDAVQQETIIAANPASLVLTPETGSATVGNSFPLMATITDSYGNPVDGAAVEWTTNSLSASFSYADVLTDANGQAHAIFSDTTSGVTRVTASVTGYPSATDYSDITWIAASPAELVVTDGDDNPISSPQTAGVPFDIKVTAYDEYGNVATAYSGMTAGLSDLTGTMDVTLASFTDGVWEGSVSITQAYNHDYITATCTAAGCLSGTSNNFDVVANIPVRLDLTPDSGIATAGSAFTASVTIYDAYGNIATSYTGTVHLSSSDAQSVLPADYTFTAPDDGTHTFVGGVILKTAGNQTLTAIDTLDAGLTDTSDWTVNAAATAHFIFLPIERHQTAGEAFSVTLLAVDEYGNQTDFSGDVTIADQSGTLSPVTVSMSGGIAIFNATITMAYPGDYLTAASGDINGSSNNFDVNAAAPWRLILSPENQILTVNQSTNITASLFDRYDNPVPQQTILWEVFSGPGIFPASGSNTHSTVSDINGQSTVSIRSSDAGRGYISAVSGAAADTASVRWQPLPVTATPPQTTTVPPTTTTAPPTTTVTPTTSVPPTTTTPPQTTTTIPPTTITPPQTTVTPPPTTVTPQPATTTPPQTITTPPVTTPPQTTVTPPPTTTTQPPDGDGGEGMPGWAWVIIGISALLLILLLILYCRSGIYGIVLCSPENKPVDNSRVILTDENGSVIADFITKSDGKYHFRRFREGIYNIEATHSTCIEGEGSKAITRSGLFRRTHRKLTVYNPENQA